MKKFNEYENFRNNLKRYRKINHLTQEQLAAKTTRSASYIKQIEAQKEFKNVTLLTIMELCEALDIHITDLFAIDNQDKTEY